MTAVVPAAGASAAGAGAGAAAWALRYAVDHGLVDAADVLDGRAEAHERSFSHTTCRISVDGRARWYVKRADPRRSRGRDLGAEPLVYGLARRHPRLRRLVPECVRIDGGGRVLALRALPGEPVARPDAALLRDCAASVAQANAIACRPFGARPWLLDALDARWGGYGWLPDACARLLRGLRAQPELRHGFAAAAGAWRRGRLVHGDVRWTNVVAAPSPSPSPMTPMRPRTSMPVSVPRVRLLDWELACCGDPAWDVATMLADVVAAVALDAPADDGGDAAAAAIAADAAAVLAGYRAAAAPGDARAWHDFAWHGFVVRAARLAGVRLVQTVLEIGDASAAALQHGWRALGPWVHALLRRPADFAADWLAAAAR